MKLPILDNIPTSRDMIDVFGGYNHNLRISSNEFYDMQNLTSTHYPVLSPRGKRGTYLSDINLTAIIAKDSLCFIDGSDFVKNEYRYDIGLRPHITASLVSMGAYVIIVTRDEKGSPIDKKWFNTLDDTHGDIEAAIGANTGTEVSVSFEMCKVDGSDYENVSIGASAPAVTEKNENGEEVEKQPKDIPLWLDTSGEIHSLKQYSKSKSDWTTIATTYVKMTFAGYGEESQIPFAEGDGVTISGIENKQLSDLNNTMVVESRGYNYIVVTGICDQLFTQEKGITVERRMPNLDFITESGNRLWGCRYGVATNGQVVNEIYACKLGDFKNWNCFMGLSTDSYAATVGTDGQFTGAITHLGYPLFFKETCLHKVYGNYPANYQIQTTACRGVQKGCEKSLAIVNETLFYKARSGVCAYDGSLPTEISSYLGDVVYSNAVAGAHGNKYYISMQEAGGKYHLFVFDTARGMWHREDSTRADAFCSCRGEMYYIDHDAKDIRTINGSGTTDKEDVEWMAETGVIGTDSPDKKYVSRLNIRMSLDIGTKVDFYAQYDSIGEWEYLFTMRGTSLRTFTVPVRPQRCDHMRLRIVGKGDAKIFSISKTVEEGSDV